MSRFGLGFVSGVIPPSIEFLSNAGDASGLTTYSFSSVPFGAEDATRFIVAGFVYRTANSGSIFSSVSIGGQPPGAAIVNQLHGDGFGRTAWFGALVPTGASGTISFTLNGQALRAVMVAYSFKNLLSTSATDTASGTPPLSIDVAEGGFAIGMGLYAPSTGTSVWTGLTKDVDASVGGSQYTSASAAFPAGAVGQSVGLMVAGSSPGQTVALASFR